MIQTTEPKFGGPKRDVLSPDQTEPLLRLFQCESFLFAFFGPLTQSST